MTSEPETTDLNYALSAAIEAACNDQGDVDIPLAIATFLRVFQPTDEMVRAGAAALEECPSGYVASAWRSMADVLVEAVSKPTV